MIKDNVAKNIAHYRPLIFFLVPLFLLSGCFMDRYEHFFSRAPLHKNSPAISVQKGDNLYQISKRYDVTLRDLIEINNLKPPYYIRTGQALLLPQKRIHIVRRHETLTSIARKRNVDIHSLVTMNNLKPPYKVHENQRLKLSYPTSSPLPLPKKKISTKLPKIKKIERIERIEKIEPLVPIKQFSPLRESWQGVPQQKPLKRTLQKKPSTIKKLTPVKHAPISKFQWPVRGKILAKYGKKSAGLRNDGINIEAKAGTPIKAAESGQVVYVGNALKGYGNLILIKHQGGWMTAYAHAQKTFVSKGIDIKKGQKIALVGSTGNVKTPQLHFEIRKKTRTVDPVGYLK